MPEVYKEAVEEVYLLSLIKGSGFVNDCLELALSQQPAYDFQLTAIGFDNCNLIPGTPSY